MSDAGTDAAVERLAAACEAVERHGEAASALPPILAEVALLQQELRECAATCPDGGLGDDLDGMAAELEALLGHLERQHEPAPALTG